MSPIFIAIAAFLGVTALVGGAALLLRSGSGNRVEDRLDILTGAASPTSGHDLNGESSVLAKPLDQVPGLMQTFFERFGNVDRLFEQADTSLTVSKLSGISAIMGLIGAGMGAVLGVHPALMPVAGLFMAMVPLLWLLFRRKRRLKAFAAQLPDALEMLSRTLRAGQSLGFGFNMIAGEMSPPISKEFGRVFEEQNLGIPMEETLENMTNRIPNLDLKFFATAIILQRQTGGDLAEILDKIGALIRERFKIWGQVQALTGEGRLSGVILLGMPFVLLIAVYQTNPDYISVLFTDPLGKKMLAVAAFLQVLGAVWIRKVVNIKV
ncbi:MAG TPA: type II secretion system F family protein [Thermoguttaceae bacterium]|nr:type II secretion system F family protein [Thermoguttaceae bacterium]